MIGADLNQTRAGPALFLYLRNPVDTSNMQIVGLQHAVTTVYCFADR